VPLHPCESFASMIFPKVLLVRGILYAAHRKSFSVGRMLEKKHVRDSAVQDDTELLKHTERAREI
jgi:hypothetical protein